MLQKLSWIAFKRVQTQHQSDWQHVHVTRCGHSLLRSLYCQQACISSIAIHLVYMQCNIALSNFCMASSVEAVVGTYWMFIVKNESSAMFEFGCPLFYCETTKKIHNCSNVNFICFGFYETQLLCFSHSQHTSNWICVFETSQCAI